jgi:hypothetical protein
MDVDVSYDPDDVADALGFTNREGFGITGTLKHASRAHSALTDSLS